MPLPEDLIGSKTVAEMLHVKIDTVRQYVARKLLVPVDRVGTAFVFSKAQVEAFARNRRGPGNPSFSRGK